MSCRTETAPKQQQDVSTPKFPLKSDSDWMKLDQHLQDYSYIEGYNHKRLNNSANYTSQMSGIISLRWTEISGLL